MITSEFPPTVGGIGYYVFNLGKKLVEKGHQITVITRGYWKKQHQSINGMEVFRVYHLPLYPFHLQFHGFFVQKLLKSMERDLDIVHVHLPGVHHFYTSLPVILTVHTLSRVGMTCGPVSYSLKSAVNSNFVFPVERAMLNKVNLVTSVSYTVAEELQRLRNCKAEVIGNGVDTKFFTPKELNNNSRYVFFSGRLIVEKGLLDLVESAKYVCEAHPSVSFVLAGSGPLEDSLRQLIQRKGLKKNFLLLGSRARNEILKYYQNSTVFVLPSYYESFPNTLLEAMACGIPVVTTTVCDMPKIVIDGENGYLVPPKDPIALSKAILELLDDETLRRNMRNACRKRVETFYTLDTLAEKALNRYNFLEELFT